MDLHHLHTYIRPQQLEDLTAWDPGWNWLAGGTWLFSQPQPHLRGLIDLHPLDWNELEISAEGLKLGQPVPSSNCCNTIGHPIGQGSAPCAREWRLWPLLRWPTWQR